MPAERGSESILGRSQPPERFSLRDAKFGTDLGNRKSVPESQLNGSLVFGWQLFNRLTQTVSLFLTLRC